MNSQPEKGVGLRRRGCSSKRRRRPTPFSGCEFIRRNSNKAFCGAPSFAPRRTAPLSGASNEFVFRSRLFLLPVLLCAPAVAQTTFVPDLSKPEGAGFVVPYAPEGGVAAPVRVEKLARGWKMTATAGGSLGVKLNVPPFDADQLTRLSFDYTRSPDAKVNLFFRVNGRYFAIIFSGPKRVRAGTSVIYDAGISNASGHVEIPLRVALRAQMPDADSLKVDEVLAGNWDNLGYLLAGIGGNGPGANWTISNFKLERPNVKPLFSEGRWEGQELVIPAKDLDALSWRGLRFRGDIGDGVSAKLDPTRGFVFDAVEASETGFSSTGAPFAFKDGQSVKYELLGEGGVVVTKGSAPFHFASLPNPLPPHLMLSEPKNGNSGWLDFETASMTEIVQAGANTALERDQTNPYNGIWSDKFTNTRLASPFDARFSPDSFDVAQRPAFTFAYRCDDRLRLDLNLTWNNQPYSIHFTDSDNPNPRLGDLNAVRDGQWHLATFDLLGALKKAKPDAKDFKIQNLQFSDTGWPGNVKGLSWWLDDWKWAPKTNGKLEGEVGLLDASGTKAVSYVLDQEPATSAGRQPMGGSKLSLDLGGKTGLWWLHVCAQNGAGKWSETAHYPIWCG